MATLRSVDWFNHHRLFGPIGHIPPAEAEANYYAANETLDMVARLKPIRLPKTRDASIPAETNPASDQTSHHRSAHQAAE
jgi:hypothetical protein